MNAVDDFHRTMFSTRFVPWCDTQCVASPPAQRETVARFIDSLAERGCHLDSVTIIWTAIMQAHADAGLEDPFRSLAGIADAVSALGRITEAPDATEDEAPRRRLRLVGVLGAGHAGEGDVPQSLRRDDPMTWNDLGIALWPVLIVALLWVGVRRFSRQDRP